MRSFDVMFICGQRVKWISLRFGNLIMSLLTRVFIFFCLFFVRDDNEYGYGYQLKLLHFLLHVDPFRLSFNSL